MEMEMEMDTKMEMELTSANKQIGSFPRPDRSKGITRELNSGGRSLLLALSRSARRRTIMDNTHHR